MPPRPLIRIVTALLTCLALGATLPAAAQEGASSPPPPLPGASDDVTVTPSVVVLGQDREIVVDGRGFEDCPGDFHLELLIDDTWSRSDPGFSMGEITATIGASGDLHATIPVAAEGPADWTGNVVMTGGCLGDVRRLFGPVVLAVSTGSAAKHGIDIPGAALDVAGFVMPAAFIDNPGAFHHLTAWAGDMACSTVDVAGGALTPAGDAVVFVGLDGQPDACRVPGATVTFSAGREDTPLVNTATLRPGIIQGMRPVYPAPSSGDPTPSTTVAPGPPDTGATGPRDPSGNPPFALIAAAAAALLAGTGLALARRH